MKRLFWALLAILLLASTAFAADYEPSYLEALKKDNPNVLSYYLKYNENCPFTEKEADEIINNVFIRSRIKTLKNAFCDEKVYLYIGMDCEQYNNLFIYSVNLEYGRYDPKPAVLFYTDIKIRSYGVEGKDDLLRVLKEKTEKALVPYLKANFNL